MAEEIDRSDFGRLMQEFGATDGSFQEVRIYEDGWLKWLKRYRYRKWAEGFLAEALGRQVAFGVLDVPEFFR